MFKKLLFLAALFFITFNVSQAQGLIIRNKKVFINNTEFYKIEKDDVVEHSFYLSDTNDNQLLYFKWIYWANNKPSYYEAYYANDLDTVLFESEDDEISFRRYIIKKLFRSGVLTNEGINAEKLHTFSKKIGKEFSRRRDQNFREN